MAQTAEEVILPPPTSEPIAELPKYEDGIRCLARTGEGQVCSYVVRRWVQVMQQHCKKEHGWVNP